MKLSPSHVFQLHQGLPDVSILFVSRIKGICCVTKSIFWALPFKKRGRSPIVTIETIKVNNFLIVLKYTINCTANIKPI
jgi:hypothetical protein